MTEHEILVREMLQRDAFGFVPGSERAAPDPERLLSYFRAIRLAPSPDSGPSLGEILRLVDLLFSWKAATRANRDDAA